MATHVITTNGPSGAAGHHPSTPTVLIGLRGLARKLLASWAWYETFRQTTRELNGLSDRELDDIGIPRRDIPTVAMTAANAGDSRR